MNVEVKENNNLVLYNYNKIGLSVLIHGYAMCKSPNSAEFSGTEIEIPSYGWNIMAKYSKKIGKNTKLKLCMLLDGIYKVDYESDLNTYEIQIQLKEEKFSEAMNGKISRVVRINLKVLNHKKNQKL